MNRVLKKQIDELINYELSIKDMYSKLAKVQAFPDEVTDEEIEDANNIREVLNKVFEIEDKKIAELEFSPSDLDSIEIYLIGYYYDISSDDFLYEENHLERLRLFNKIRCRIDTKGKKDNFKIQHMDVNDAVLSAIDTNYIKIYEEAIKEFEDIDIYVYLLYARLYISPYADRKYFLQKNIKDLLHYSHYKICVPSIEERELKDFATQYIHEVFIDTIETLYNGYTNKALEDEENEIRAIINVISIEACLTSTLDPTYIDERYKEFKLIENKDPDYSDTNDLIVATLKRSKKLILDQTKK